MPYNSDEIESVQYLITDDDGSKLLILKKNDGDFVELDVSYDRNDLQELSITDTHVVDSQAEMLALAAQTGDVAVRTDLSKSFILTADAPTVLGNWQELLTPTDAVSSVNGRTGTVTGLAEQSAVTAADSANLATATGRAAAFAIVLGD